MTNLVAVSALTDVPQLETSTLALAGPGAVMNAQAQALLNRQQYYFDALMAAIALKGSLDGNNTWTGAQRGAFTALTSASNSIAVDLDDGNNFSHTLTEDTTLAAPSHAVAGQTGVFYFTQHASAPKTLALDAFWGFGLTDTHIMTTTLSGTAVMSYIVDPAGTSATCSWMNKS